MTNKLQGCRNTSFRENMASLVHDMLKLMEIARHPKRDVPYTAEKNGAEGQSEGTENIRWDEQRDQEKHQAKD